MNAIPRRLKYRQLIIMPAMMIWWMTSAYAETVANEDDGMSDSSEQLVEEMVDLTSDISQGRTHLQMTYALTVVKEAIKFLQNYPAKYNNVVSPAVFQKFVAGLLKNEEDPIIQSIKYVPEQSVTIMMRRNSFVESELQNQIFFYRFEDGIWVMDSKESTVAGKTDSLVIPTSDFNYCMAVITEHCQTPTRYQAVEGSLSDEQWCPTWHTFVMPPQKFFPIPPTVAEADAAAAAPMPMDIGICMSVITNHCNHPQGFTALNFGNSPARIETWSDTRWCPSWHDLVSMSP